MTTHARTDAGAPVLEVDRLGITFGGLAALSDVSFKVRAGETVGLIGPNGAGKSTVLNCICGFYTPTSGTIRVDGESTAGMPAHEARSRGIARTFQETLLIDDMSLLDNVLLGQTTSRRIDLFAGLFNTPKTRHSYYDARVRASRTLEEYGLLPWASTPAASAPYGVRKLTEVVRAQFQRPKLLLLDEPAAGLTGPDAEVLAQRIRMLADRGIAVVLIDHNIEFVAQAAHHIVVMSAGSVLAEGTPAEVRSDQRVAEAYLGTGGKNNA